MADRIRLTGLLCCLLISQPLAAHKLKVFASAEDDRILGRAYFVGGAGAGGAAIRITDDEGRELARLQPDAAGNFDYRVEQRMSYRVVADSLDGHQASWTLQADEFSPRLPPGPAQKGAGDHSGEERVSVTPPASVDETGNGLSTVALERAVARQIRPLREALLAHEEQVRLRDILGAIGYIIGLAGLGLWWGARRRKGDR